MSFTHGNQPEACYAWPDIVLYEIHPSYYSQMARMALNERHVPYTKKSINILEGENYEPEYVKINPACEVPAMKIDGNKGDGKIINGSQPIMDYIANLTGKTSGENQQEVQDLRRRCFELPMTAMTIGLVWYPDTVSADYKMPDAIRGVYDRYLQIRGTALEDNLKRSPPELKAAYEAKLSAAKSMETLKNDKQQIANCYKTVEAFLDELDQKLGKSQGGNEWLFGAEFTDADIMVAVLLARLELIGLYDRWISPRKNLAEYYRRVKQRPSFQQECVATM